MFNKKMLRNLDWSFVTNIYVILGISLLLLSSASRIIASDPFYYFKKQILWIIIGTAVFVLTATLDYNSLFKYANYLYGLNLVILLGVLLVGRTAKGAQRWISIGPFDFQPSEFAKLIIIVSLAAFLAKRQGKLNRLRDFIPPFFFTAIPMLLILKQPDLGTALVFIAILFGMMFVAGARPIILGGLILGGIAVAAVALYAHFKYGVHLPLKDYQLMRLVIFINPQLDPLGSGYHVIQSMVAIGSGGLLGKGFMHGTQVQLNFLPEHHTDFIFSVVGEEFGFVGAVVILLVYFSLLYKAVRIAIEAKDVFGALIVSGIVSMFAFHLLVNMGMTMGIMPVTGIPLPLLSYGGSTMLTMMMALGLVVNVNINKQRLMF